MSVRIVIAKKILVAIDFIGAKNFSFDNVTDDDEIVEPLLHPAHFGSASVAAAVLFDQRPANNRTLKHRKLAVF